MNNCNICNELDGRALTDCDVRYEKLVRNKKNIILETEDFVVIPSVGPLNESHAMIVPRTHWHNFASIPESKLIQAEELISELSNKIKKKSNHDLVFFESGAGSLCTHSGGCIVHAHIHCVYHNENFETNLFNEVKLTKTNTNWQKLANTNEGYVWYRGSDGTSYIANNPQLPSQFLRYLYSASSGDIRFWNWRRHNNYQGVLNVLENYAKTP